MSMFLLPHLAGAFARAFAELPKALLWEWADENVWLVNKEASEPGPYRSSKTPWTRRLQEIIQRPLMWCWDFSKEEWVQVRVTQVAVMKSSQSGFSEACLNGIRYRATYRPCNVIYAIDTREAAKDISERLRPSLERLGGDIFTGDDDDVGTYVMRLRAMDIWFTGGFSTGKFANKQAPLVVIDEQEEHPQIKGDTSNERNLASRTKTAPNGLLLSLSKPKLEGGPIHRGFKRGNQEEYCVACPHCGWWQWPTMFAEERDLAFDLQDQTKKVDEVTGAATWLPRPLPRGETVKVRTGRLVFDHCRDLLGNLDELAVLRDTYYECCHCQGRINEDEKVSLRSTGRHLLTSHGSPGMLSQGCSDLLSDDAASAWGQLVLDWSRARTEGRAELQGFHNHRLGRAWREEIAKTTREDLLSNIAGKTIYRIDAPDDFGRRGRLIFSDRGAAEAALERRRKQGLGDVPIVESSCPPYRRGSIPFFPRGFLLGADIGGAYAKWAVGAVLPNNEDVAVIDWGMELDPDAVAEVMIRLRWAWSDGEKSGEMGIGGGFMDAKYRKTDAYRACLSVPGRRLVPTAGLGGGAARGTRIFGMNPVPTYKEFANTAGLQQLVYNDKEAKDELYLERIKRKNRRLFLPVNVEEDEEFIAEMCAEELIEGPRGMIIWNEHPGPNHYGDCVKGIVNGLRFLTRSQVRVAVRPGG